MAVTLHNATLTAGPTSAAARTLLHTATAGSVLLVWTQNNEAVSMSAVAAGTNPLTRIGAVSAGTTRTELWALTSPPAGTLTVSAAPVGANVATWCLVATSYVGQRQIGGSPFGTVVAGTATAANVALSVSSTSTDLVAFGFGISANTTIALNAGTLRANATLSTLGRLVVGDITGATTLSISATSGASGVWGMLAVPIIASAAAATTSLVFDNAATTSTSTTVNSYGLLLTATSNAVLLVFTHVGGGDQTISAINVGAMSLTRLGFVDFDSANRRAEIWGLTAPPSGILTISAVVADGAVGNFGIGALTYTGHKTTGDPFGGVVAGSAAAASVGAIVVSSTAGNLAVAALFGNFTATSFLAGPGTTQRFVAPAWPHIIVEDTPGQLAVTAEATANNPTPWGMLGINLIQSGAGASIFSANVAVTDVKDTVVATSYLLINGLSGVTDKRDTVAAPSQLRITGAPIAITDNKDSVVSTARLRITGQASITDVKDSVVSTAQNRITATVSVADQRDTVAVTGYLLLSASVAVTDRMDTIAVRPGAAALSAIVAVTDVRDTVAATSYLLIQGAAAVTDAPDTVAANAQLRITAAVSATDNPDTVSIPADMLDGNFTASVNVTDNPDSVSILATMGSAPDAPVVTTLQDGGSGGGHGKKQPIPYSRAPDDFWDAREHYLKALQPELIEPEPVANPSPKAIPAAVPSPKLLQTYRIQRAQVIDALPQATNMRQLQSHGRRLAKLNRHIAEQKHLEAVARERARLAAKELAERKRRRKLRKLKRKVAALAIGRLLGLLTHVYGKL